MIKIAKKPKFKPRKGKNGKIELRKDIRNWILFTMIYIPIIIVLYGTADHYYPDPLPLFKAFNLQFYGDFSTGIIYTGIAIWSLVSVLIFKTKM